MVFAKKTIKRYISSIVPIMGYRMLCIQVSFLYIHIVFIDKFCCDKCVR